MFRQSPRRNGRNKGLKIKHVLQISVLLGVSVWLLYQLQYSADKKESSVKANITDKLRNDSSKETYKLGRKDLRPKVKERNETKEHKLADENEGDELVHDHEIAEHEEVGGNGHLDGGEETHEDKDVGMEKKGNGEKGGEQNGVKIEKMQTEHKGEKRDDGGRKNEVATKEENGSEKNGEKEGNKGNEKENKKESIRDRGNERKKEEDGKKKKVKQVHKTDNDQIKGQVKENKSNEQNKVVVMEKEDKPKKEDDKKLKPNPKKVEISSLSSEEEDDDDNDQSVRKEVENVSIEKYNEKRLQNKTTSSGNEPSHDEHNKPTSKKYIRTDENQNNKTVSNKQTVQQEIDTSPDSYLLPSFDQNTSTTTNSTGKSDSDYDSEAQEDNELSSSNKNENNNNAADESESEQTMEKDGESTLEEEKDALTDLGTLPESETGGRISHEDAATE